MFKIGSRVIALDDDFKGKIIDLLANDYFVIEDETGFDYTYHKSQIIIDANFLEKDIVREFNPQELTKKASKEKRKHSIDTIQENQKPWVEKWNKKTLFVEIDLHIHELIPSYNHLTNTKMLQLQMDTFKRCLEYVENNKIKELIAIHGLGQGVLRTEIHKYIKNKFAYMEISDANYKKYGMGASCITIYYNRKR